MTAERYPVGPLWTCLCLDEGRKHHLSNVSRCFACGMANPNPPRVSRPVAATAANGGPPANDTPVSRSPGRPAPKRAKQATAARQPTATEQRYYRDFLAGKVEQGSVRVVFEGLTLHLANGHAYTPDWVVFRPGGIADDPGDYPSEITLIEVKGRYKLGSYQRARLAFDQARIEYPEFEFVWHEEKS